ncbi:hypothetical protein [Klebsiella pneumoniae]|uniref:hypothetical protein n=1 Tax=Klebsiella pneumoniae TaxID=573 RepID=UPI001D185EC5|nr:hypothetical protein [Klebsiella pneumoniae]
MNIETVNELIASLESAGELSIREQKFLKLAKEFRICSASLDAAIKTGNMLADQNAQLAAENVGLKSFGDKLNGMHNALNGEGTGIQGRAEVACQQVALEAAIEEFDAIETPATDAFLAGIKADAIDEAALDLDRVDTVASTRVIGFKLREFAKQLREGADK